MKINKNIRILIAIAVLIIANVVDYKLGTHIYPLLFLVILIALVVYLLILQNATWMQRRQSQKYLQICMPK